MSTKDPNLSQKPDKSYGSNNFTSNSDPQFTNLNLNQNHKCHEILSVQSKSISNKNDKIFNNKELNCIANLPPKEAFDGATITNANNEDVIFVKRSKRHAARTAASTKLPEFTNSDQKNFNLKNKTFDKSKNSPLLSSFVKSEKAKNNLSTSNSSTLSLHIVAYENSVENDGSNNQDNSGEDITNVEKNSNSGKKWKNAKQIFTESTSAKSLIEIPRQQKEEEAVKSEPEIMQFKASQKLLHPNQQQQSKKKSESKKIDGNSENMDTAISSEMAQNRQKINHCRIMQVLSTSTEHFQRIFKERWLEYQKLKKNVSNKWNDSTEDRLQLIKLCPTATSQMKESFKTDNIELWDITLLNHAIQALRSGGAVNKLEDTVINCIRETRNKIVHGKPELPDQEFEQYFNQLSTLMIKLGDTKSAMDELKDSLMKIGEFKVEPKTENVKIEYKKLKNEANKLFQAEKYNEAIVVYNQILEICGLSRDDQAIIYSNISAAYYSMKTKDSYLSAKRHADFAIQLRPIWWRGYFRLGKAEHALGNLREARKALKSALNLESGSVETRNELGAVCRKLDEQGREDYLHPDFVPDCYEKELQKTLKRLNVTEKQYIQIINDNDAISGDKWRMGYKGQQDFTKAAAYYSKSAANGNISSMLNLAKLYRKGEGVERNYKETIKLLKKVADSKARDTYLSSIREAQHFLGILYQDGEGVKKDYSEAFKWYEKGANNGYAASATNLGFMYLNGQGVNQSPKKAFSYFKCGSESGDTAAMQNLAELYFHGHGTPSGIPTINDKAEGIKWLKRASTMGNQRAQKRLEEVEKMEFIDLAKECLKISDDITTKSNPMDKEQFYGCIKEAEKKGSISAQRLLEIWKQIDIATDAFKKNNSKELVAALSQAIRMDHQIVTFPDLFRPVIIERYKNYPADLDAVTCYVRIIMTDENNLKVITEKLEMFPKDEFLLDMKVSAYLRLNDLKSALMASNNALELYPTSPRIMYGHACVLLGQCPPMKEGIKMFNDFIAVAPYDHHRIPTCHYLKADYYHGINDIPNFKSSFEAAIAAEKTQLPCFLPYDFSGRERLKSLYALQNYEENPHKIIQNLVCAPPATFSMHESLEKVMTNPRRKHLIIQLRQLFILARNKPKGLEYTQFINFVPDVSKPPDLCSLKKIMIKDIVLAGDDKIHEGFILKARVVEWSLPMLTPSVLIQDENGDVERLTVCGPKSTQNINYKREIEAVMKRFRPGVTVSIINPYMKQAVGDGQNVIRVDNEAYIIVDCKDVEERCSCCGRKAKVNLCKCKMSQYCSEECQKYDREELNHNSVCKFLKTYNTSKK